MRVGQCHKALSRKDSCPSRSLASPLRRCVGQLADPVLIPVRSGEPSHVPLLGIPRAAGSLAHGTPSSLMASSSQFGWSRPRASSERSDHHRTAVRLP